MRPAHAQRGALAVAALLAGLAGPAGVPDPDPGGTRRAPGRAEIRARRKLERRRRRLGRRFARG